MQERHASSLLPVKSLLTLDVDLYAPTQSVAKTIFSVVLQHRPTPLFVQIIEFQLLGALLFALAWTPLYAPIPCAAKPQLLAVLSLGALMIII